jgi:hypothetical protein
MIKLYLKVNTYECGEMRAWMVHPTRYLYIDPDSAEMVD